MRAAEKKANDTASKAETSTKKAGLTEEQPFELNDLIHYWFEFANLLPKEETATAGRMKNMKPKLIHETTFEVTADNEMVKDYLKNFVPKIEQFLRTKLHNRHISMEVRLLPKETKRAYSRVEQYQLMVQKNPHLQKLKEQLGLELH